jgi:hypothetical protein
MGVSQVALLSSTIDKWVENKFVDNISKRVSLLGWLASTGRLKKDDGSGVKIREPVLSDYDPERVQALAEFQEIDLVPQEGMVHLEFTRKVVVNDIAISYEQMEQNSGEAQKIDLLESKTEQSELEISDQLQEWLFGDGTDREGLVPLGLSAIISATPALGTLGGYSRVTNTWLRNNQASGAKSSTAYDNLRKKMNNMFNTCKRGSIRTELMLTSQTIFEAYTDIYFDKWMATDQKMADLGFDNIKFRGGALSWAEEITTAIMYFLNSKALRFRSKHQKKLSTGSVAIFKTYPMVDMMKINKMRAYSKVIEWNGALTANMFRTLGILTDIS